MPINDFLDFDIVSNWFNIPTDWLFTCEIFTIFLMCSESLSLKCMFVCCILQQEAPCALAVCLTLWVSPSCLPTGARVIGRPAWQLYAWRPGNTQRLCCSQPTYLGQYQGQEPEFLLVSVKSPTQWEGKTPVLPLVLQSYQPRELPLKSSCIAQRRTRTRNKGVIFAYTARFLLLDIRNYNLIMNACCPLPHMQSKQQGKVFSVIYYCVIIWVWVHQAIYSIVVYLLLLHFAYYYEWYIAYIPLAL